VFTYKICIIQWYFNMWCRFVAILVIIKKRDVASFSSRKRIALTGVYSFATATFCLTIIYFAFLRDEWPTWHAEKKLIFLIDARWRRLTAFARNWFDVRRSRIDFHSRVLFSVRYRHSIERTNERVARARESNAVSGNAPRSVKSRSLSLSLNNNNVDGTSRPRALISFSKPSRAFALSKLLLLRR